MSRIEQLTGAGIGDSLRGARERAGLDLAGLEARTKIRKRYLQALEEERWSALPSPAHARSFLRTVADELGLDSTALVDRLRREAGAAVPGPLAEGVLEGRRSYGQPGGGSRRRGLLALAGAIALAGAGAYAGITLLGETDGDGRERPAARERRGGEERDERRRSRAAAPAGPFRLVVEPRQDVVLCLVAGSSRALIDDQRLDAGTVEGPFEARSFRLDVLTGGIVRVTRDGRVQRLASEEPARYEITARRIQPAPIGRGGRCP